LSVIGIRALFDVLFKAVETITFEEASSLFLN